MIRRYGLPLIGEANLFRLNQFKPWATPRTALWIVRRPDTISFLAHISTLCLVEE